MTPLHPDPFNRHGLAELSGGLLPGIGMAVHQFQPGGLQFAQGRGSFNPCKS
jgi:hypothetical protein